MALKIHHLAHHRKAATLYAITCNKDMTHPNDMTQKLCNVEFGNHHTTSNMHHHSPVLATIPLFGMQSKYCLQAPNSYQFPAPYNDATYISTGCPMT